MQRIVYKLGDGQIANNCSRRAGSNKMIIATWQPANSRQCTACPIKALVLYNFLLMKCFCWIGCRWNDQLYE